MKSIWIGACICLFQFAWAASSWAGEATCAELNEAYERSAATGRFQVILTVEGTGELWAEIHYYDRYHYDRRRGSVWMRNDRGIRGLTYGGMPVFENCTTLEDENIDRNQMTVFQADWQRNGDKAKNKLWFSQKTGKLAQATRTFTALDEYTYFYSLLGKTVVEKYTYDRSLPPPEIEPPLPVE